MSGSTESVITFQTPLDPRAHMEDWDHERWPVDHLYHDGEIVITFEAPGYRWHLPHGVTGYAHNRATAKNRACQIVRHACPVIHYGETIRAARSWGHGSGGLLEMLRSPKRLRNVCTPWLLRLASLAIAELKSRDPDLVHQIGEGE